MDLIKVYFSNIMNIFALIFFCGVVMDFLEKISLSYGGSLFGQKVIVRISAYIGTPIHELGHAFFAILFGHSIKKIVLFPTAKSLENGCLGYVSHSWNKKSFYQRFGNFFIGIGPMFSGPIAILIILKLLLPEMYNELYSTIILILSEQKNLIEGFVSIFTTLASMFFNIYNLSSIRFYLFLFLGMNIAAHMGLSLADMKHCLFSFIFLGIIIVLVGFSIPYFPIINDYLIIISSFLIAIFSIAMSLSIINALIFVFLFKLIY